MTTEQMMMTDYRGTERLSQKDRCDIEKQIGRFTFECGPVITYKMASDVLNRPVGAVKIGSGL